MMEQKAAPTDERYRCVVDDPGRESGPWYPFFHLRNEPFWHLHARLGRESAVAEMERATSERTVETNVSHASLDPLLHALLLDREASVRLWTALIDRWFPTAREAVTRVAEARDGEHSELAGNVRSRRRRPRAVRRQIAPRSTCRA